MVKLLKKEYLIFTLGFFLLFTPTLILAVTLGVNTNTTFKDYVGYVKSIVDLVRPILMAMAFILFFWGLSKFILNSNNSAEIEKGKAYMIWGVLALFILLTFMAIVGLISRELEIGNKNPTTPTLPTR